MFSENNLQAKLNISGGVIYVRNRPKRGRGNAAVRRGKQRMIEGVKEFGPEFDLARMVMDGKRKVFHQDKIEVLDSVTSDIGKNGSNVAESEWGCRREH